MLSILCPCMDRTGDFGEAQCVAITCKVSTAAGSHPPKVKTTGQQLSAGFRVLTDFRGSISRSRDTDGAIDRGVLDMVVEENKVLKR